MFTFLLLGSLFILSTLAASTHGGIHLEIRRRGGRFAQYETANLDALTNLLAVVEKRYSLTYRDVAGNHLIRRWRTSEDGNNGQMLTQNGHKGTWYTVVSVGEPPQSLEMDLDMISPDFFAVMTTCPTGSKYNTFASSTYVNNDNQIHPFCTNPSDVFHFPQLAETLRLDFPTCNPSKATRDTLAASGVSLGLSPASFLSRLSTSTFTNQLFRKGVTNSRLLSITLLDADSGILSFGDSIVREVEEAKIRGDVILKHLEDGVETNELEKEIQNRLNFAVPLGSTVDHHFKWVNVQGAQGWWTGLIAGVWMNGVKVLKNQPVLFDVNCPFVLAPPTAVKLLYESIGGAKQLQYPDDRLFGFPCLNTVHIAFEIGGWNFALQSRTTRSDLLRGPSGGLFSLGKMNNGTGFCVGIIAESRMSKEYGPEWSGSGMQDVWVLGEPFFRGTGVVFDAGTTDDGRSRIGVRTY